MAVSLTPMLQQKIEQAQRLQSELEAIIAQRYQLEISLREVEKSLDELENLPEDAPIYKSVGSILVRVESKERIKRELEDKKETLELRIKTVMKQQELLERKLKEIQEELARYGGQSA